MGRFRIISFQIIGKMVDLTTTFVGFCMQLTASMNIPFTHFNRCEEMSTGHTHAHTGAQDVVDFI